MSEQATELAAAREVADELADKLAQADERIACLAKANSALEGDLEKACKENGDLRAELECYKEQLWRSVEEDELRTINIAMGRAKLAVCENALLDALVGIVQMIDYAVDAEMNGSISPSCITTLKARAAITFAQESKRRRIE